MNDKCWYKDVCESCNTDICNEFCIRYTKMRYLIEHSLLPKNQQYIVKLIADEEDLEAFKQLKDIQCNIEQIINEGKNLLIVSKITGNGKTEWEKKIMFSYFDAIWHKCDFEPRALFINVPTFFNALRDNIDKRSEYVEHIKQYINTVDLVIWDEIGVKTLTPFEHDHLLSYINTRVMSGKSNIYSSNLSEDQLLEALGDRLYSRVVNMSKVIELRGKDKRGLNKW